MYLQMRIEQTSMSMTSADLVAAGSTYDFSIPGQRRFALLSKARSTAPLPRSSPTSSATAAPTAPVLPSSTRKHPVRNGRIRAVW
jgi:hypothetical protein